MIFASLLAALLATSPEAAASAIEWEVPLACPGADWLTSRVEAYLGRPLDPGELERAVDRGFAARVRASEGRFELELNTSEASAQRHRVSDHDCQRLAEVAASLLAIAIDPLALGSPVVPVEHSEPPIVVPPPAPRSEPPVEVAPVIEAEPPRVEPDPVTWELIPLMEDRPRDRSPRERTEQGASHLRGLFLADAGLALGLFPDVAPQVHAGVGVERREPDARVGLRVELAGGAALAGRFRATDGRELGGDLIAWDLALRPCVVPRWGLVDLRGCAAVGAGQLRGRGIGVQNPQWIAQPWVWAGADLGLAVALRRRDAKPRAQAALFLDVGAGVNALRPNFVVLDASGGPDVRYVLPLVSGHGRFGVEVNFF
jgi:hypothetical protein